MKAGALKYLARRGGHTLYVSAADQVGTLDADPVSACDKECLATFTPFRDKHLSVGYLARGSATSACSCETAPAACKSPTRACRSIALPPT